MTDSAYTDYRCDRCGEPTRILASAGPPEQRHCAVPGCNGPLREIELEMDDR